MTLYLNKAHFPVDVLGHGPRVGLWLQGCTIRCFGCISRDTWNYDPETSITVSEIMHWVESLPADAIDGVTISGGEPFDQPDALAELLRGLRAWGDRQSQQVDLLCYSGRPYADLERDFVDQLALLDAVIPEPYRQGEPTTLALRGSANQRVVPLSDLGWQRYSPEALEALGAQRHRIQYEVDGESIWFIGIPEQGAMRRIRERANEQGIAIQRPSWLV